MTDLGRKQPQAWKPDAPWTNPLSREGFLRGRAQLEI